MKLIKNFSIMSLIVFISKKFFSNFVRRKTFPPDNLAYSSAKVLFPEPESPINITNADIILYSSPFLLLINDCIFFICATCSMWIRTFFVYLARTELTVVKKAIPLLTSLQPSHSLSKPLAASHYSIHDS